MEFSNKNIVFDLVHVTEAAALSAANWIGSGDKEAGDGAAVDAMRLAFNALDMQGKVIIGEGEKDEAPMLYIGEEVGTGRGPKLDIAVDPVEGTNLLAKGRPNAIAVMGACPAGTMYNPGPSYYMQKMVVGYEARNVIDLDAPVKDNLTNVAKAIGKKINELVVFILEKPRHEKMIQEIRATGAKIQLHTDGDVAGALMVTDPRAGVDVMMGTGGTPEGVIAACAIKGIGGQMLCRLNPQSETEKKALEEAGIDTKEILTVDTMIKSDEAFFAATGITSGNLLRGVTPLSNGITTHSLAICAKTATFRYIEHRHLIRIF